MKRCRPYLTKFFTAFFATLSFPVYAQSVSETVSQPQNNMFEISEDDPALDVLTVPLFSGEPFDLSQLSLADLRKKQKYLVNYKKAHDKYPDLRSCIVDQRTSTLNFSEAFNWDKYESREEVIICMTAIAQWSESPDRLSDVFSEYMGSARTTTTTGPNPVIVRGFFDRRKYPRVYNIWEGIFYSWIKKYSVTRYNPGISVSFKIDGNIDTIQPIPWGN